MIVERWNGLAFDKPYQRVRDTLRFLRAALSGEKVTEEYETFHVDSVRLGRVPAQSSAAAGRGAAARHAAARRP